ncbi:MAG: hypothetical protein AABY22_35160 [Nanoarchaeota archaeon]
MAEDKKDPKELRIELDRKAEQAKRNLNINLREDQEKDPNQTFGLAWYIATQEGYGKNDREVFTEYIYDPALKGEELLKVLKESRQNGEPLTGEVSERAIAQRGQKITLESLIGTKVGDVIGLLDVKTENHSDFGLDKDKYIAEYLEFGNDVEKARATELIGTYWKYKASEGLAEAYKKAKEQSVNSLKENLNSDRYAKKAQLDADVKDYKKARAVELGLAD